MVKNSEREPSLNEPQIERFKEAAREFGCDEDEASFDEKIKAIVNPKGAPPKARIAEDDAT